MIDPDHDPLHDWYRHLYGNVEDGWISFLGVDRGTGEMRVEWCKVTDLASLVTTTRNLNTRGDVWNGVAVRTHRTSGRGGATECGWITTLWADIDFVDAGHAGNALLPPDEHAAKELVRHFPVPPTAVTHTGGGLQVWHHLDEPVPVAELGDLLESYGATWNRIGADAGYHVDNVFDLARIMRAPGTVNRKIDGHPRPVSLIFAEWDRRHGVSSLRDSLDDPPIVSVPLTKSQVPYIGPDRPGDDYSHRHDGHELLSAARFHSPQIDSYGNTHYRAPHRGPKEQAGATVYAEDGHVTIWSETFAVNTGTEVRRPYDPFGLYVALHHAGDFRAATAHLRAEGYGSQTQASSVPVGGDDLTGEPVDPLDEGGPSSWLPVDLDAALAGLDVAPPILWMRSDNTPLIYAGRVHWLQGPPESLKSMAAQAIAAESLMAGDRVLYIDFEDDDRGVVARFLSMGVPAAQIRAHLTYVRPDEALQAGGKWTRAGVDYLALVDQEWRLAVIDGVTEAMSVEGLEMLDNTDNAKWMRLLPKRLSTTGAAVVVIDHTVKSAESAGRYAIGGQHKLAGVTGATYKFETIRPLARATSEEITGQAKVTITKDRPGWVRGHCTDGVVGMFEVTSYPDGGLSAQMMAPGTESTAIDLEMVGRILTHLEVYDGLSTTALERAISGSTERVRAAALAAVGRGWVQVRKGGNGNYHHLTDAGRKVMK